MGARASKSAVNASAAAVSSARSKPTQPPPPPPRSSQKPQDSPDILQQNLRLLGQVKVDAPTYLQKSQEMTHVVRTRALSETDTPSSNTIDAFGLSDLLDQRKHAPNAQTAEQLAKQYRLDPLLVERLAAKYNSPSVARQNTVQMQDGEQRTYREAVWIDPPFKTASTQPRV